MCKHLIITALALCAAAIPSMATTVPERHWRGITNITNREQSQGQIIREATLSAETWHERKAFGLAILHAERFVARATSLTDATVEAYGSYTTSSSWRFQPTIGFGIGREFLYHSMAQISAEHTLKNGMYYGLGVRRTTYAEAFSAVWHPIIGVYHGPWHLMAKGFLLATADQDVSLWLRAQYELANWIVEASVTAGQGDSSRPYLTGREQEPFRIFGLGLGHLGIGRCHAGANSEWRTESAFFERAVSGWLRCTI